MSGCRTVTVLMCRASNPNIVFRSPVSLRVVTSLMTPPCGGGGCGASVPPAAGRATGGKPETTRNRRVAGLSCSERFRSHWVITETPGKSKRSRAPLKYVLFTDTWAPLVYVVRIATSPAFFPIGGFGAGV